MTQLQNQATVPQLKFIFEAKLDLGQVQNLGNTSHGQRRIIPIVGGTFWGENLSGTILPSGADWQTIRADGTADLDARFTLQTTDGTLIYAKNTGLRTGPAQVLQRLAKGEPVDANQYYMRGVFSFEVETGLYDWLSHCLVVASSMRVGTQVIHHFYKVL